MNLDTSTALSVAAGIADHLCRTAYRHDGRCTWMGASADTNEDDQVLQIKYETVGPDLYGGTAGIGLFLAELYARAPESAFRATAVGAIAQAISRLESIRPAGRLGLYTGTVGVAYASARVGRLLNRPDLLTRAGEVVDCVADPEGDLLLDVVSGAAGAALALLHLADLLGREDLANRAFRLGRRILGSATKSARGWSWGVSAADVEGDRHLTGFAHGAAGVGWSLLELYRRFAEPAFLQGALEAVRYENYWFRSERNNWPDLEDSRGEDETPVCRMAWCHGAPGIGLSRVHAWQTLGDAQCRLDAEAAARAAKETLHAALEEASGDFSLCHGLSGIAEFVLHAAAAFSDEAGTALVLELAGRRANRYASNPQAWPCGVFERSHPSLMLGLAGIGYFYLRLADPATPSVLLIQPDGARRSRTAAAPFAGRLA